MLLPDLLQKITNVETSGINMLSIYPTSIVITNIEPTTSYFSLPIVIVHILFLTS